MNTVLFSNQCKATLENIQQTRKTISKIARLSDLLQPLENKIILAISEVLTNCVEHGKANYFEISFEKHSDKWIISIHDDALAYNPLEYQPDDAEQIFEFDFEENGRGIFLIKQLCDSIDYEFENESQTNHLTLNWLRKFQQAKPSILIIDDDKTLLSICRAYCNEDYDVTICDNAHQAIKLTQTTSFDLILSDIKMPEMNGLQLREQILQDNNYASTPFLFITGLEDQIMIERASYLNIDGIIKKPINKHQLLNNISQSLVRSKHLIEVYSEKINHKITQALSPSIPKKIQNWNIEFASRNTGSGGGDLVYFSDNNSDRAAKCVIADFMGHDETAKFFAFSFMGYLRGIINSEPESSVERIINRVNQYAYKDDLMAQTTLTILAMALSKNGQIAICNAGHPQPLKITSQGISPLSESGMLPGLLEASTYTEQQYKVNSGERIAVFTDGLFESANSPEQRTQLENKILIMLQETLEQPIDRAIRQIMSEFDTISGTPAKDDVLLILLEPG